MDLRAILSRQAAKKKVGESSRTKPTQVTHRAEEPFVQSHSPTHSSGSAATPRDSSALERKRKRTTIPTPEVVVLPSSQTEGGKNHPEEPSSARSPVSPPRYPLDYKADTNLFTAGPSSIGFNILHSLGSAAEQQYLASSKLKPCTLEGCNDIIRVRLLILYFLMSLSYIIFSHVCRA